MNKTSIVKRDNSVLKALFAMPEPGMPCKYILVVCHGFRGRKENSNRIFNFAKQVNELGIGVIAFDFTGCGESDGAFADITVSRQAQDLSLVIQYIHENYKLPVILLGRSMGGSTILAGGAQDSRVEGYIFWSACIDLKKTFAAGLQEKYEDLEKGKTVQLKDESGIYSLKPDFVQDFDCHNMDAYLQHIGNRPVLIIHGTDDEVVTPDDGKYIFEKVANGELYLVEGADHQFTNREAERENLTLDWLKKYFG